MKYYRFFASASNVTVGQGKFRSDAQVKKVAQQLSSSMNYQVEFEEISELNPDLPIISSGYSEYFEISIFILGGSLLVLLLGIIGFQVFMPNQAAKAMEQLFPSQLLLK